MLVAAVALASCAGSPGPGSVGSPTGGEGRIADFVGTYSGDFYSAPTGRVDHGALVPDGTAGHLGTVSLTISSLGDVTGIRHDATTGGDQTLTGTIDDQGQLELTRPGTGVHGTAPIHGYLVKEEGLRALATLVEDADSSEVQTWYYYRLSGESTGAGRPPLTTGRWLAAASSRSRLRFVGKWYRPDIEAAGNLNINVSASGSIKGSWKEAAGTLQTVSGELQDIEGIGDFEGFAGTFTVAGRALQVRLIVPSSGSSFFGLVDMVGTASTDDGSQEYAMVLRLAE